MINIQRIIYDSSLIMAIIAINMTIIGLTSLADFKKVIGIDYGSFLIKKFKLFTSFKIYHALVVFAIINVSSLFFMFINQPIFRLTNFLLLVLSLIFAIYYFFSFIIVENKTVKRQIYQTELEGLYYKSNNEDHHEADVLTRMNAGSSNHNKVSSNLIDYFNTYNHDTQSAFKEVFGPDSLLYEEHSKRKKRYKKRYGNLPYEYRQKNSELKDISFEFFQFFRFNNLQDKWAIEILRLMDGEKNYSTHFEPLRLYNFARLIAQINLFVRSGGIYKYKFLEYLKEYFYYAVSIPNQIGVEVDHIKVIEKYTFRQLCMFLFKDNESKDQLFCRYGEEWMTELISSDKYKGVLTKAELIELLLEESLEIESKEIKTTFAKSLSIYYGIADEIPNHLTLGVIKHRIRASLPISATSYEITREELFSNP